jgi:hypothetical protein
MQELQFCIQDFDFSWSMILKPLFQTFMTSSSESGWDDVDAKSAFPSLLLAHRSLSVQSNSFLHCEVTDFVLYRQDCLSTI